MGKSLVVLSLLIPIPVVEGSLGIQEFQFWNFSTLNLFNIIRPQRKEGTSLVIVYN